LILEFKSPDPEKPQERENRRNSKLFVKLNRMMRRFSIWENIPDYAKIRVSKEIWRFI